MAKLHLIAGRNDNSHDDHSTHSLPVLFFLAEDLFQEHKERLMA